MQLLGDFLPETGWPWVTPFLAQVISIFGFLFITLAIGMIIVGFSRTPKVTSQKTDNANQYTKLYNIVPILRKMNRYLWAVAQGYKITSVDIDDLRKTAGKINELMNVKIGSLDPKKSIAQWLDDAKRIFVDEKGQVDKLIAQSDLEKNNRLVVSITRILDDDGYGLKDEKKRDKKYRKYKKKIDNYFDDNKETIDSLLSYLIHYHIHMSEFFANSQLVIKRSDLISAKTSVSFKDIAGAETQANLADLENDTNERLNEIRIAITDHIRELESAHWLALYLD